MLRPLCVVSGRGWQTHTHASVHVSSLPAVEVAFETERGDGKSKLVELDYVRCTSASRRIIRPHPGLEERCCGAVAPEAGRAFLE